MHSLFLRGCVTDRTTAARISNSFDFLRLLVVYDRQSNGTLPAISDILAMRDLAGAVTTTSRSSSRNDDYKDRFKILLDRGWGMNDNTDGALVAAQRVAGPYPSSIRYYILSQRAADKIYCGCSLLYCDWIRSTIYGASWEPMLLPMQITLSLWKEGLHILTIKISNKFFFQNSISFILGCFLQSLDIIKNCSKPLNDRCGAADGS